MKHILTLLTILLLAPLAEPNADSVTSGTFDIREYGAVGDGKPDVLLIVVDDLNDWVGCLGGHGATIHNSVAPPKAVRFIQTMGDTRDVET